MKWWVALLVVGVLAALAFLAENSLTPQHSVLEEKLGSSDSLAVESLSGEQAELFAKGLKEFCNISKKELYKVQLRKGNNTYLEIYDHDWNLLCNINASSPDYLEKRVALLVNDKPIYLREVLAAINSLPRETRVQATPLVINNLVNKELLLQQAERKGLRVSKEELEDYRKNNPLLSEAAAEKELLVQKAVKEILEESEVSVSEEDVRDYYEARKENLTIPESWVVRHVQVNIEGDEEVALKKAETLKALLNNTDFCDLVKQFSDDKSSIDKCGRYEFSPRTVYPSVEEAVKEMKPGDVKIIKTPQSYHLLQFLENKPPRNASYEEVKDQLRQILEAQKKQEVLRDYLNDLRQEAKIISYIS